MSLAGEIFYEGDLLRHRAFTCVHAADVGESGPIFEFDGTLNPHCEWPGGALGCVNGRERRHLQKKRREEAIVHDIDVIGSGRPACFAAVKIRAGRLGNR